MTTHSIVFLAIVTAACSKSDSAPPDQRAGEIVAAAPPSKASDPPPAPVIDAARVNALVPPALVSQLSFAKTDVARKSAGRDVVYSVLAPTGWADAHLYNVKLRPTDETLADTRMEIASKCDGSCSDQDWNKVSERLEFAAHREQEIVKEERRATNHLLIARHADDGLTYVIYSWWDKGNTPYHTCTVVLEAPLAAAAEAFALACKGTAISGHF
jgi:hypothetical protein